MVFSPRIAMAECLDTICARTPARQCLHLFERNNKTPARQPTMRRRCVQRVTRHLFAWPKTTCPLRLCARSIWHWSVGQVLSCARVRSRVYAYACMRVSLWIKRRLQYSKPRAMPGSGRSARFQPSI